MRIAPLGALAAVRKLSVDELREYVRIATRCTHSHVEALDVALVYCLAVQQLFALEVAAMPAGADCVADAKRLLAMLEKIVTSTSTVSYVRDKFGVLRSQFDRLLQQNVELLLEKNDEENRARQRSIDKAFLNAIISPCQVLDYLLSFVDCSRT